MVVRLWAVLLLLGLALTFCKSCGVVPEGADPCMSIDTCGIGLAIHGRTDRKLLNIGHQHKGQEHKDHAEPSLINADSENDGVKNGKKDADQGEDHADDGNEINQNRNRKKSRRSRETENFNATDSRKTHKNEANPPSEEERSHDHKRSEEKQEGKHRQNRKRGNDDHAKDELHGSKHDEEEEHDDHENHGREPQDHKEGDEEDSHDHDNDEGSHDHKEGDKEHSHDHDHDDEEEEHDDHENDDREPQDHKEGDEEDSHDHDNDEESHDHKEGDKEHSHDHDHDDEEEPHNDKMGDKEGSHDHEHSDDEPEHSHSHSHDHDPNHSHKHEHEALREPTSGALTQEEVLASYRIPQDAKILYYHNISSCNSTDIPKTAELELKNMCDFMDIGHDCPLDNTAGDIGLEDVLLFATCKDGNCSTIWSKHRSTCFVSALTFPQNMLFGRDSQKCGMAQAAWDMLQEPVDLYSINPDDEAGMSCGLGFPGGLHIQRHLECVEGTSRIVFQYKTEVMAPQGVEYFCVFDYDCYRRESGISVCYQPTADKAINGKDDTVDDDNGTDHMTLREKMVSSGLPVEAEILYFKDGASCKRDTVAKPVKQALVSLCKLTNTARKCSEVDSWQPMFVFDCKDGSCEGTWSRNQTLCILKEWEFDLKIAPGKNGEVTSTCGVPDRVWKTLSTPVQLWNADSEESDASCGLGLPLGVQMQRALDCINGEPKLVLKYNIDKDALPEGSAYSCAIDMACNIRAKGVFPGFAICYSLGEEPVAGSDGASLRSVQNAPKPQVELGIPEGADMVFLNENHTCEDKEMPQEIQEGGVKLCDLINLSNRCCCDAKTSDEAHFIATCKNTTCSDVWSHNRTLCYLKEAGYEIPDSQDHQGHGTEDALCGLYTDTWGALHDPIPIFDIPSEGENSSACSQGLPQGVAMDMQLKCLHNKPRLQFTTRLGVPLPNQDSEYKCIFAGACRQDAEFNGLNVCYLKPREKQQLQRTDVLGEGVEDGQNAGSVASWKVHRSIQLSISALWLLLAVLLV